jgi:uncharacterized damage-inducible protein DinB
MQRLRSACVEGLAQISQLLECLSASDYVAITPYSSSTVGAHVRHVLDHFSALRLALIDNHRDVAVNYNRRHRQSLIENDLTAAKHALSDLCNWLASAELTDGPIRVHSEISVETTCDYLFLSTINREILYLINHTVHHAAYMRVIANQLGVDTHNSLGIAPATGSYRRAQLAIA